MKGQHGACTGEIISLVIEVDYTETRNESRKLNRNVQHSIRSGNLCCNASVTPVSAYTIVGYTVVGSIAILKGFKT